ncbi:MAG: siphovirus ReqiPepy6 Gp37-like family protein [Acutalibacter sp.]|nr:siphovirus ReqiPepy6 Gp37-like family protein [Acutalibacter sp.]
MQIFVFTPEMEVAGIISTFESLVHTRQFAGSGSFKLTIPFTEEAFHLLAEDNILFWDDKGQRTVYIDSVVCETEKDGEYITASGKNLRGILGRRIVWKNFSFAGTVEDFARRIVNENAVNPSDDSRKIPLLSLGNRAATTHTITTQTENENVETLLDDLTAASGVGFDIVLNKAARQLNFIVYEGVDRRTTQQETPWVVISRDRNNVISEVYTRSSTSFRNTALISGYTDEETGERYEDSIVEGSGLSRREIYIKGSATKPKADKKAGITEAQAILQYKSEQQQKAKEKLADQTKVLSLEVDLDPGVVGLLGPGDKVTAIEKKYNLISQTYVSEITAYYERGGVSYDVTLGNAVPSIYKKIKKELF